MIVSNVYNMFCKVRMPYKTYIPFFTLILKYSSYCKYLSFISFEMSFALLGYFNNLPEINDKLSVLFLSIKQYKVAI